MPFPPRPFRLPARALRAAACAFVLAAAGAEAKHLYQYTDAQGVVHFTDIKPAEDVPDVKATTVRVDSQPLVRTREEGVDADRTLVFVNTSGGPVTVELSLEEARNVRTDPPLPARVVLPARSDTRAVRLVADHPEAGYAYRFRYRYMPGDWRAQPDEAGVYQLPFDSTAHMFRISQAFGGKGSHTDAQNFYAVDITMPEGTPVLAAREGTVMTVENDYFGAGLDLAKFAERANNVRIVHADGSMAVYAHLALESVRVQVGDRVRAGQVIALSGDTGYTTGPHLHFCVQRNADMDLKSIPFRFEGPRGAFTPEAGMMVGE
jgi:murein DD-endopeptidase MepM/ murein hydrolase activator NlpD